MFNGMYYESSIDFFSINSIIPLKLWDIQKCSCNRVFCIKLNKVWNLSRYWGLDIGMFWGNYKWLCVIWTVVILICVRKNTNVGLKQKYYCTVISHVKSDSVTIQKKNLWILDFIIYCTQTLTFNVRNCRKILC